MHLTKTQVQLRLSLQKGLSILVGILMAFFGPINIMYFNNPILGFMDVIVSIFSFYCFWATINNKDKVHLHYILALVVTVSIYITAYTADFRAFSILWALSLPMVYYIMFGTRQGAFFSFLILITSIFIINTHTATDQFMAYRTILNYVLAHCFICFLCHLYEQQQSRNYEQLKKVALSDALTGVQNRHALEAHFCALDKSSDRAHILLIDIDFFKKVNDQFGHGIGDHVLVEMAECLQTYVDVNNIFRLGGEEFVLLFKNHTDVEIKPKAENIRRSIEQYIFHSHDLRINITISIGVSRFLPGQSLGDFLRTADKKLYDAKSEGRNCVCI
ncbi:diguanylate cyclase [Marinomonas sp. TI.3.20]|uniref:GGDEF domain-containing protein n=1 Tax=Marinomonas sp. TI.3.20 TaxID=3121296 RepID=UPI00311DF666